MPLCLYVGCNIDNRFHTVLELHFLGSSWATAIVSNLVNVICHKKLQQQASNFQVVFGMSNTNPLPTAVVNPMVSPSPEINENHKVLSQNEKAAVWRWNGSKWIVDTMSTFIPIKLAETLQSVVLPNLQNIDGNINHKDKILPPMPLKQRSLVPDHPVLSVDKSEQLTASTTLNSTLHCDNESNSKPTSLKSVHIDDFKLSEEDIVKTSHAASTVSKLDRQKKKNNEPTSLAKVKKEESKKRSREHRPAKPAKRKRDKSSKKSSCVTTEQKKRKLLKQSNIIDDKSSTQLPCSPNSKKPKPPETDDVSTLSISQLSKQPDHLSREKSHETAYFVPSQKDIMTTFSPDIVTCAFCHLPANYLPVLGDLFGPYRPTFTELVHRYDDAQKKLASSWNTNSLPTSRETNEKSEIRIDRDTNTCFVTSSSFKNPDNMEPQAATNSVSGTEKRIHAILPRLRMLQTVNCLLSESNKKPVAKLSRTNKILIPGFSGTVKSVGISEQSDTSNVKNMLHDLDTVVFVEPNLTFPHHSSTRNFSSKNRSWEESPKKSKADITSIGVVHKFDTSAIWTHAVCAVWSPGVYCVKDQLFGMTSAVQNAQESLCDFCHRPGATISCKYQRNICFHYLCAIAKGLKLDEETLMAV